MKNLIKYCLPFALAAFIPTPHVVAQDYVSVGVGMYEIAGGDSALDLRAEYRPDVRYLNIPLKPWAGVEVTSDLTAWAGGGILYDWNPAAHWYVTPSLGAGLYTKGNSDQDLDFPVQFRSQIEVSYEFENLHRAGIALSHLSNAGLGDTNSGAEAVSLYWHMPY